MLYWLFLKTNFFRGIPFSSVPFRNWLFRGIQNEHLLPRNNGIRSERFRSKTLVVKYTLSQIYSIDTVYYIEYLQSKALYWIPADEV
jgi:hypothetical protein